MSERINPFSDLYLTEAISSSDFVRLFSPVFVEQATALYQSGNVILKGLQGSGKSMLLNLLKPETRLAYKSEAIEFPVPPQLRKFISGGINLRKSGVAAGFAQLITPNSDTRTINELALHFGDCVNYWIVDDLLNTIELHSKDRVIAGEIGITMDTSILNEFAHQLSQSDSWLNGIKKADNIKAIRTQLNKRIVIYKKYMNLNTDDLPPDVKSSKTIIGEPISATASLLKQSGVLQEDVNVLLRIDQYELLPDLDLSGKGFGQSCQTLVHKALSSRSGLVSYRIGVRNYAWPDKPQIFATNESLEEMRDFSDLDIDDRLRRKENDNGLFPKLSRDIFYRRVSINYRPKTDNPMKEVLGSTLSAKEKCSRIIVEEDSRINRGLRLEDSWPDEWKQFLKDLCVKDPFSAKLAEAWVRQKEKGRKEIMVNIPTPPYPWDKKGKVYWKKERAEQALLQLASRNRQRPLWGGVDDVIGISNGNVLVFLFICQHIWDSWIRNTRDKRYVSGELPNIDLKTQSYGIEYASGEWM
ncbi:MAG: hypothetical protein OXF42_06790, partial [Candidatus Dadabacteria bacterium]|nr:hypothetical protein [Candidatus Dadabacteria bacterium]